MPRSCPSCEHDVDLVAQFCPKCGAALGDTTLREADAPDASEPASSKVAAAASAKNAKATMLGMAIDPEALRAAAAEGVASPAAQREDNAGRPAAGGDQIEDSAAAPKASPRVPARGKGTMMGMPAVVMPQQASAGAQHPAEASSPDPAKAATDGPSGAASGFGPAGGHQGSGTGLASSTAAPHSEAQTSTRSAEAGSTPSAAQMENAAPHDSNERASAQGARQPAEPRAPKSAQANRTMIGQPAMRAPEATGSSGSTSPGSTSAGANGASSSASASATAAEPGVPTGSESGASAPSAPSTDIPDARTNRTMLGQPVQAVKNAPAESPAAQTNRTMLGTGAQTKPTPAEVPQAVPSAASEARKSKRSLWPLLFALLLIVVAGAGALMLYLFSGLKVVASVGSEAGEEVLRFEFPETPDGFAARFSGATAPIEGGVATFPLNEEQLQVGENPLRVSVVSPEGDVETTDVVIQLNYRIRADLTSLQDEEPSIRIVVQTTTGWTASIGEELVALDANGRGVREYPLEASDGEASVERSFSYSFAGPEGAAQSGELEVSVPVAALRIVRPVDGAITDRTTVEIAGAVHEEASVTVGDLEMEVTGGRFSTEVPLELGENLVRIRASRGGRAPRDVALNVTRVDDLSARASSLEAAEISYSRLEAALDSYRGRTVVFTGTVFNAGETADGPMMQVLVDACSRGQRCPLWVDYDGALPIELNQEVRIFGAVDGQQQYRTADGEVGTSPRIRARIVLVRE